MGRYSSDAKDLEQSDISLRPYRDNDDGFEHSQSAQQQQWQSLKNRTIFAFSSFKHNSASSPWRTVLIASVSLLCGWILSSAVHSNSPNAINRAFGNAPTVFSKSTTPESSAYWTPSNAPLARPANTSIIGFIFYGRPMFVNLLDCYLRKNLAINGGYLDEVHFVVNTQQEQDLLWLDNLVAEVPQYVKVVPKEDATHGDWTKLWEHTKEVDPDTILVKIDDDIIFIADDAIPRMVNTLVAHPEAWATSAQIVNTPHSQFWQYHTGGLLPYLPDPIAQPVEYTGAWRASQLPRHPGNGDEEHPLGYEWNFTAPENAVPQHRMTRWLPLERTSASLWQTPATGADWPAPKGGSTQFKYSEEIYSWSMAAQTHYSFLEHLENDELWRYYGVGTGAAGIWDMQYERYSLNFMAIRAGAIAPYPLWLNDEVAITMWIPSWRREPWLVDTHAVVSHYSFSTQHELMQTDVLQRYYGYANEMICEARFGGPREIPAAGSVAWHGKDDEYENTHRPWGAEGKKEDAAAAAV